MMADLTVIILTKNEEVNIKKCIDSVKGIAKRIIVLDSFSTDKTICIARQLGAETYMKEFVNHGEQFQYALDNFNITTKWIFKLDADEEVTLEAAAEIEELCMKHNDTSVNGIIFKLEVQFLGKPLRHGGAYPLKRLSIFKTGLAYMEIRDMNEHLILKEGQVVEMEAVSKHDNLKDLSFWIQKHNWYASKMAKDYFERRYSSKSDFEKLDKQTKRKRLIKEKIYYHMPVHLRCWMYFIYRYVFKFGFLDGKAGLFFTFFQAYWFTMLIGAKIYEAKKCNKQIKEQGSL